MYVMGRRRVPPEVVNIDLAAFGVPPALIDKRLPFSGSGTASVKRSRLVIGGRFECLEDLSHFLAPLVGVGAVHPAGCHF